MDNTLEHADIILKPSPEIEQRIHNSVAGLRVNKAGMPCYVLTLQRDVNCGLFPASKWTTLANDGSFVLLKKHDRQQRHKAKKRSGGKGKKEADLLDPPSGDALCSG